MARMFAPRLGRLGAVAIPLAALAALVGCGGGEAEGVRLQTDFESSGASFSPSDGASLQAVSPDRMRIVSSPVAQGNRALRVEVRQGDDPIDSTGDRAEISYPPDESEGDERWYSFWVRFDRTYPFDRDHGWQIFTQWHSTLSGGTQPPVQFFASGNEIGLKTSPAGADGRARRSITWWEGPMRRGTWRHIVLHARWSASPKRGFLALWVDGRRVLPRTRAQTLIPGSRNYLKQGLYRSDRIAPTAVLFLDGLTVTDGDRPPPLR
jgi:hypothetical protein